MITPNNPTTRQAQECHPAVGPGGKAHRIDSWPVSARFSELMFRNVWTARSWWLFIQVRTKFLEEVSTAFEILAFILVPLVERCQLSLSYS